MKQTLAILKGRTDSNRDWIKLLEGKNCNLLICTDCIKEEAEEDKGQNNVSYQPCAKEAAWEADLLLLEITLSELKETLPRLSPVARNKPVLLYPINKEETQAILKEVSSALPLSTVCLVEFAEEEIQIKLFHSNRLLQTEELLKEVNFQFSIN